MPTAPAAARRTRDRWRCAPGAGLEPAIHPRVVESAQRRCCLPRVDDRSLLARLRVIESAAEDRMFAAVVVATAQGCNQITPAVVISNVAACAGDSTGEGQFAFGVVNHDMARRRCAELTRCGAVAVGDDGRFGNALRD